jgi:hypothetical protein
LNADGSIEATVSGRIIDRNDVDSNTHDSTHFNLDGCSNEINTSNLQAAKQPTQIISTLPGRTIDWNGEE